MIGRTLTATGVVPASTAIIFGDSITDNGYVFPDGNFYESSGLQIGSRLGIQMQNLATSGETTRHAFLGGNVPGDVLTIKYPDFTTAVTSSTASTVYLRYGIQQAIKATNESPNPAVDDITSAVATFQADLQSMVSIILDSGKTPVVVGLSGIASDLSMNWVPSFVPPPGYVNQLLVWRNRRVQLNAAAQTVAGAFDVTFVDIQSIAYTNDDFLDGINPQQAYSRKMVELIARASKDLVY